MVADEIDPWGRDQGGKTGGRLVILSMNGGYAGYVVPRRMLTLPAERQAELWAYETRRMNFLGPWGAEVLLNTGMRLAERVR